MRENKKMVLSFVMDDNRKDIDFLDHKVFMDSFGNCNVELTTKEKEHFLSHNNLQISLTHDEHLDSIIYHICRGDIVFGQAWNSLEHKNIWLKRTAVCW